MIDYQIIPLIANRYRIIVKIKKLPKQLLNFYLPVWIAGSYMRRDFVQHVSCLRAQVDKQPLSIQQTALSKWQIALPDDCEEITISYEYYARDYSVRGCYLDDQRGFFNPGAACIGFENLEQSPHQLRLALQGHWQDWDSSQKEIATYQTYQEMLDAPIMIGKVLKKSTFSINHIPHEFIISGLSKAIPQPFIEDVIRICNAEVALFKDFPRQLKRYQFLLFLSETHYGGLEHQQSTLLMAPRKLLNFEKGTPENYEQLLGLVSHEYFHQWNIKSMRPEIYAQGYNLQAEQPSEMLWFFEGFTAYYDNWVLRHSGVIDDDCYLRLLAADISRYLQRTGRRYQSLAQSSFEAWTKLYHNGEDALNRQTNYYGHGALAAFMMDLFIIEHSESASGLLAIIVSLWHSEQKNPQGINEQRFIDAVCKHLPQQNDRQAFQGLFYNLIHACGEIDFDHAFQKLGISCNMLAAKAAQYHLKDLAEMADSDIGFQYQEKNGDIVITRLYSDSQAAKAGLSPEDKILQVNHQDGNLLRLWQSGFKQSNGDKIHLKINRQGEIIDYHYPLDEAPKNICHLSYNQQASAANKKFRKQWINRQERF